MSQSLLALAHLHISVPEVAMKVCSDLIPAKCKKKKSLLQVRVCPSRPVGETPFEAVTNNIRNIYLFWMVPSL